MKRLLTIATSVVFLAIAPASADPMPELIAWPNRSAPLWVSTDLAIDQDGYLREEYFAQHSAEELISSVRRAQEKTGLSGEPTSSRCYSSHYRTTEHGPLTFERLVSKSERVFFGTVRDVATGFVQAYPVELVMVEIDAVVKGDLKSSRVFLLIHSAEVVIEGVSICSKFPGIDSIDIGDRVGVFSSFLVMDAPMLINPTEYGLVVEKPTGQMKGAGSLSRYRDLRTIKALAVEATRDRPPR